MLLTVLAGNLITHTLAWQAQDSIDSGNSKLLLVFVIVAAVSLFAQFVVIAGIGIVVYKAQKAVMGHIGEIKAKAYPIIEKSQELLTELRPKITDITEKVNVITGHVEHIAAIAKEKADEFSPTLSAANQTVAAANVTAQDINAKTRAQVTRVNGMVSSALDATVRLGVAIERGITAPGREVAGIVAGLKVGLTTLMSGVRGFAADHHQGKKSSTGSAAPRTAPPYRVIE